MAARIETYLDTSALIAFLDRSDSYHSLFHRLFSSPPPLVTSALVLAEGHGWFLRRYDRLRATQFIVFIELLPTLTIMGFDASAFEETARVAKKYSDQNLTLADAHGLAIIRERRISSCWSTDRHMGLGGARLVTREKGV
jgi:predicted nucleic acid-binding protein